LRNQHIRTIIVAATAILLAGSAAQAHPNVNGIWQALNTAD
jgi:hypothetical protein